MKMNQNAKSFNSLKNHYKKIIKKDQQEKNSDDANEDGRAKNSTKMNRKNKQKEKNR